MSKRKQQPNLFELFPDLAANAPEVVEKPVRAEPPLPSKPRKPYYEIMQEDGDAVVVRSFGLLPALTQRGMSFEVARAIAQEAQQSLLNGAGSYEVGGMTIRRFEE